MSARRNHDLLATVAYLFVCFLALPLLLAIVIIESGGRRAVMELLRDSAPWPLVLLALTTVLIVAVAVLGAFYLRGARIPGAVFVASYVAPLALGALASFTGLTTVFGAIESADPGERAKLLGQGIVTACGPLAVGAAAALLLAFLVCSAGAAARLTAAAKLDATTLIIGGIGFLGSFGAHAALGEITVLGTVFWAAMIVAVFGSSARTAIEDPFAWRRLALVAAALVAAALLVRVADHRFRAARLPYALVDCMSGLGFEHPASARSECELGAVETFAQQVTHAKVLAAIDCVAAVVVHARSLFAPAVLARGVRSLRVSFALGALVFVSGGAAVLGIERLTSNAERGVLVFASRLDKTGIELPALHGNPSIVDAGDGPLLTFGKDAALKCEVGGQPAALASCGVTLARKTTTPSAFRRKEEEGTMGTPRTLRETLGLRAPLPVLVVDAHANALAVLRAVQASTQAIDVRIAFATTAQNADVDLYLGRFQPSLEVALRAQVDDAASTDVQLEPSRTLGVLLDGPSARIISLPDGGAAVSVPLDGSLSARRQWEDAHLDARTIVIAPANGTDWQTLIDVASAFRDAASAESKACAFACEVMLTADRGRFEELAKPRPIVRPADTASTTAAGSALAPTPPVSSGPRLNLGALHVDGSLNADIVRRTIRTHQGQLAYCFESRLNVDPSLRANGTLRLVVGPSGQVQAATTTIADTALASCITNAASRWMFPMPANDGSVIATQTLEFHP
jgi:hypothetical protein